ncbi:MAG: ABC transporter ATP-binding protein [Neisseriaceae bacterium]|nr:ABC transporter ATP-binding protein [Neisseriaceae bacterium]MBP6861240.1 ABC transporter ATP-binding protein [Neisseriaceae bacterium]
MEEAYIRFENVSKFYGDQCIIENLNLTVNKGEFISLLGPSGSGKTTILMLLAGFEAVTKGSVLLNNHLLNDMPAHKRNIGVVFQNYALFPHMSIAENIAFPLQMRGVSKSVIQEKVRKVLDMVKLLALKDRRPAQLSGGQQQRVALARALVFEPEVVLMDEPLGALDKQLREQMQLDIRELHRQLGLTIVFVTHDQEEALTMSDRIAVFNKGQIEQIAPPRDIYDYPQTKFVAEFIGATNLIDGVVERLEQDQAVVAIGAGKNIVVPRQASMRVSDKVLLSVRPERIALGHEVNGADNHFHARVRDSVYLGNHLRIQLEADDLDFTVKSNRSSVEWPVNTTVVASFASSDCWVVRQ